MQVGVRTFFLWMPSIERALHLRLEDNRAVKPLARNQGRQSRRALVDDDDDVVAITHGRKRGCGRGQPQPLAHGRARTDRRSPPHRHIVERLVLRRFGMSAPRDHKNLVTPSFEISRQARSTRLGTADHRGVIRGDQGNAGV